MKKWNLKIYLFAVMATTALTFFACKKYMMADEGTSNPVIADAKLYLKELVASENSLLAMPYTELKKNANLRRFSRIGKLSKAAQWDKAKSFYRQGISYSIVPVDDNVHYLNNPAVESVRYLMFSKRNNDLTEMNIIEVYSDGSLGSNPFLLLKTSVENMLFKENTPIQQLSASVIFYDRFYYNRASFKIDNGNWKKAHIVIENTVKKPNISSGTIRTTSAGSLGNQAKNILSTVSQMNGCGSCNTYYTVGIWYDTSSGEVLGMEILGSWQDCSSSSGIPPGGSPGQSGGGGGNNSPSLQKSVTNNLTNPCLSNLLSANSTRIGNFVGSALNNENIYQPMNFNYSLTTSLADGTTGQLTQSWLDGSGVLNFDIVINANLSGSSQELTLQTYLHEALHGALLSNGVAWNNMLQHAEIANAYRGDIVSALRAAFPGLSASDADDLSWGGLQSTSAYKNLPGWRRSEIENTLGAYKRGEEGTNC